MDKNFIERFKHFKENIKDRNQIKEILSEYSYALAKEIHSVLDEIKEKKGFMESSLFQAPYLKDLCKLQSRLVVLQDHLQEVVNLANNCSDCDQVAKAAG